MTSYTILMHYEGFRKSHVLKIESLAPFVTKHIKAESTISVPLQRILGCLNSKLRDAVTRLKKAGRKKRGELKVLRHANGRLCNRPGRTQTKLSSEYFGGELQRGPGEGNTDDLCFNCIPTMERSEYSDLPGAYMPLSSIGLSV